jgi:hypothetical protein
MEVAMDEPDTITATDILREHGRVMLDRMLSYRLHHHDSRGRPYWAEDVAAAILGHVEIEDRRRHGDIP